MAKAARKTRGPKKAVLMAPGGRPVAIERVESPYGNGTDEVVRVVDPLRRLSERGRLDAGQIAAATRWRASWDTVQGCGFASPSDGPSGRGKGRNGAPPPERLLMAAEDMRTARAWLGELSEGVLIAILGEGHSIRQVAAVMFPLGCDGDGVAAKADQLFIGRLLSEALTLLARRWGYAVPTGRILALVPPGQA